MRCELHKSTVWCRWKNQTRQWGQKDTAEWIKREWEQYTSFRRFWNMLLFDSVWKREGEESIGRETGWQTERGPVSQLRPNENCSWKWKCYTKEEKDTLSNTDAVTKRLKNHFPLLLGDRFTVRETSYIEMINKWAPARSTSISISRKRAERWWCSSERGWNTGRLKWGLLLDLNPNTRVERGYCGGTHCHRRRACLCPPAPLHPASSGCCRLLDPVREARVH